MSNDRFVPPLVFTGHDQAQQNYLDALAAQAQIGLQLDGEKALLSSKREAARHEAGHAVVDAALGDDVVQISIFRVGGVGESQDCWCGRIRGSKRWRCGPETPPENDLRWAQHLISGWVGEWYDAPELARASSSVDEVVSARMISATAAQKLGEDPDLMFFEQLAATQRILQENQAAHHALVQRLIRKHTLGCDAAKRFLKAIAPAPAPSLSPSETTRRWLPWFDAARDFFARETRSESYPRGNGAIPAHDARALAILAKRKRPGGS
jgi:hypothetical protein